MKLTAPSYVATTSFHARAEIVFQRIGDVTERRIVGTVRTNFKPTVPNIIALKAKSSDVTEPESKLLVHLIQRGKGLKESKRLPKQYII